MISLDGKKGLIVGIRDEDSLAHHIARQCRDLGAELAVTYQNEKTEPTVRPLAEALDAAVVMPLDVTEADQADALFAEIERQWGRLDFLLHGIAFAPGKDLKGRFVDSSAQGWCTAMDISCHSFVRLARRAEPLMEKAGGGALLTLTYYGSRKVVDQYGMMGPVKSALEGSVKYLAHELGPKGIRVHGLSPGPFKTKAASGLAEFDELLEQVRAESPRHCLADIGDVAATAAFLASDRARTLTGDTVFIDSGYHIEG